MDNKGYTPEQVFCNITAIFISFLVEGTGIS
jgi:hypothetical protein